jgi:hypothetical protein
MAKYYVLTPSCPSMGQGPPLRIIWLLGIVLLGGCLGPRAPVEPEPPPEPPTGLVSVPAEARIMLVGALPEEGGWLLWLWRQEAGVREGGMSVEVRLVSSHEWQGRAWAGAYHLGWLDLEKPDSPSIGGAAVYWTSSNWATGPIWQFGSSESWSKAVNGFLVFAERGAKVYANVSHGGSDMVKLAPLRAGARLEIGTQPLSAMEETTPGPPRRVLLESPDFSGGFAAAWAFADTPPPHRGATLDGELMLRMPDGRTKASELGRILPAEDFSDSCLADSSLPVCRQSTMAALNLWWLASPCLPKGTLSAEAAFTARTPVRYVPVLFEMPINACDVLREHAGLDAG